MRDGTDVHVQVISQKVPDLRVLAVAVQSVVCACRAVYVYVDTGMAVRRPAHLGPAGDYV